MIALRAFDSLVRRTVNKRVKHPLAAPFAA
jgi:hypothetical protein